MAPQQHWSLYWLGFSYPQSNHSKGLRGLWGWVFFFLRLLPYLLTDKVQQRSRDGTKQHHHLKRSLFQSFHRFFVLLLGPWRYHTFHPHGHFSKKPWVMQCNCGLHALEHCNSACSCQSVGAAPAASCILSLRAFKQTSAAVSRAWVTRKIPFYFRKEKCVLRQSKSKSKMPKTHPDRVSFSSLQTG